MSGATVNQMNVLLLYYMIQYITALTVTFDTQNAVYNSILSLPLGIERSGKFSQNAKFGQNAIQCV